MYISEPPGKFVEIEESVLEEFLSRCDDYRSTSYVGHRTYYFAHNKKVFAAIHRDKVFADPELLESHLSRSELCVAGDVVPSRLKSGHSI